MIKDPQNLDHYDYLNQLLKQNKKNKITMDSLITEELLKEIAAKAKTFPNDDPLTEANLNKIKQIEIDFATKEAREAYNQSLKATAGQQIKIKIKDNCGIILIATVPLEQIQEEFDKFHPEECKDGKYSSEQFTSRKEPGPPEMLILTFPDRESAQRFIEQLFNKNMATLTDGTKDMQQVKDAFSQQAMKQKFKDLAANNEPPVNPEHLTAIKPSNP